jgi:hypothetical protein
MNNTPAITRHPSLGRDYSRQAHPRINKPMGGLILTGVFGALLWLSAILLISLDGFFDRHEFTLQTPVVLQMPLVVTAIASELGASPSAMPEPTQTPLAKKGDQEPASTNAARSEDPVEQAGSGSNVVSMIREVFGKDADMAIAIAKAESGLDCTKISDTNDHGLFQINPRWHHARFGGASYYNCWANAMVAKQIFDQYGWTQWSTFNNGSYRSHL